MISYSQAGQDLFAAHINGYKTDGYFCDLGCNTFRDGNNTFLLETEYNWRGLLVDCVPSLVQECAQNRKNHAVCADLTTTSVTSLLDLENAPEILDFVSLDLDGEESRIICLKNINLEKYKMRCLCFETDAYQFGNRMRDESREYLGNLGYQLVAGDVHYRGLRFEDWYCHPELVEKTIWKPLVCENLEYTEILGRIGSLETPASQL